jgi:hypothetical protein
MQTFTEHAGALAWEYGYISGKLATLRWVLGSEWDFLDT